MKSPSTRVAAMLRRAIERLRMRKLAGSYAAAWTDWEADGDARIWDGTTGDGLSDSAR
jgi:hypothetical protein